MLYKKSRKACKPQLVHTGSIPPGSSRNHPRCENMWDQVGFGERSWGADLIWSFHQWLSMVSWVSSPFVPQPIREKHATVQKDPQTWTTHQRSKLYNTLYIHISKRMVNHGISHWSISYWVCTILRHSHIYIIINILHNSQTWISQTQFLGWFPPRHCRRATGRPRSTWSRHATSENGYMGIYT